jgi:hypothetical protein
MTPEGSAGIVKPLDHTEFLCPLCDTRFTGKVVDEGNDRFIDLHTDPPIRLSEIVSTTANDNKWLSDKPPDNPFTVFSDSYHHTGDILAEYGSKTDGSHLINRMVFSQQITALEAYLADSLIRAIREDKDSVVRLIETDRDLRKQTFSLAQIYNKPTLVIDQVSAYLKSLVYHDVRRVDFLYNTAFGIKILNDDAVNEKLLTAIGYRHDCVHRNGVDKDGNKLTVFTVTYVQDVADLMMTLVIHIEREIRGREADAGAQE